MEETTNSVVFTNGCFDILHVGHLDLLEYCSSLGFVIVGLNSDESVRQLKGRNRPILPQEARERMLRSLRFVDEVIVFDELTPEKLIKNLEPDLIVKGSDYKRSQVVGSGLFEVDIFTKKQSLSTSSLIEKIKKMEAV